MRKFTIALALFLLLATMDIGLGTQNITHVDGSNTTSVPSPVPSISLPGATQSLNNSSSHGHKTKSESAENEDFIRSEVSAGNKLFVRSLIEGIYSDFNGSVYNALVFVPNPYKDEGVVKLYGGYLNISIYMVLLFIFGTLINRSLARMKLTVGKINLSQSAFIGGIALCGFALVSNVLFSGALDLVSALNQFITLPVLPEIVPNPDNLLLFALKGLCDLVLLGFFVIRYYIIYVSAVVSWKFIYGA